MLPATLSSGEIVPKRPFTYLLDPSCLSSYPDVTFISKTTELQDGEEPFRLPLNRMVVSSASDTLHSLLLDYVSTNTNQDDEIHISTELSPESLIQLSNFLLTGCVAGEQLDTDVKAAFSALGIDLDRLDLKLQLLDSSGPRLKDGKDLLLAAKRRVPRNSRRVLNWGKRRNPELTEASMPAAKKRLREGEEKVTDFGFNTAEEERTKHMMEEDFPTLLTKKEELESYGSGGDDEDIEQSNEETVFVEVGTDDISGEEMDEDIFIKESDFTGKKAKKVDTGQNIKLFKCPSCNYQDYNSINYSLHIIEAHKNTYARHGWFCIFCEAGFETKEELETHKETVHPKKEFDCPHCPLKYKYIAHRRFLAHVKLHCGSSSSVLCIQCGSEFSRVKLLQLHLNKNGPYHKDRCVRCTDKTVTFESWDEHQKHVSDVHNGVYEYVCGLCPLLFDSKEAMQKHRIGAHPLGLHIKICDYCGESVKSELIKLHLVRNHNIKGIELPKHLKTSWVLGNHRKPMNRYIECEICCRIVRTNFYSRHLKKHERVEANSCVECHSTFKSLQELQEHVKRTHSGNCEEFSCEHCGRTMRTSRALREHIANMHTEESKKPHQCSFCPKGFVSKRKREDHENIHLNKKPYNCRIADCRAAFATIANRGTHETLVHKGHEIQKMKRGPKKGTVGGGAKGKK